MPRVFLTGCTASSGTRCARLYYGFLSCCSAYGAIDFLSAALDSDTVSRVPQGVTLLYVRSVFSSAVVNVNCRDWLVTACRFLQAQGAPNGRSLVAGRQGNGRSMQAKNLGMPGHYKY